MPDKEMEELKKALEDLKKKVADVLKQLARKMEPTLKELRSKRNEQAELIKKKEMSDEEKKRRVDIQKWLDDRQKLYGSQANGASQQINIYLKTIVPKDPKAIPDWEKDMAPWYRSLIEKEPGFNIGHGLRLSGDISIKERKATLNLSGKF